jgi:hypothetical protein
MSASEGEADFLVLRADVWKPEPDIERPAEAVISPLSFEGCTLFGFELAISPSTAVHHSGFKIKAICTNRPRPSYFYTLCPDF